MTTKKIIYNIIGVLGVFLISVALLCALNSTILMKPILVVLIGIFLAIGVFLFQYRQAIIAFALRHKNQIRVATIAIIIISILLRLSPLVFNMEYIMPDNLNDVGVHYYGSQMLSDGALDQKTIDYVKAFPYLFPYMAVLAGFNVICFGNTEVAILLSNLLFDIIGGLFCYLLLKRTKSRLAPTIGIILWAINPMSIISCWFSMNLILINMLLMATLFIGCLLLESLRQKNIRRSYFFAAIFGIAILLGNSFRPLFTVLVIAMLICGSVQIIKTGAYRALLPALIIMLTFLIIPTIITNKLVEKHFHDDILSSSGGWSFYVGSNYATNGSWVSYDRDHFWGDVIPNSDTFAEAQDEIKKQGVTRYLSLSPVQFINHIANKIGVLFGDAVDSIYDIRQTFGIKQGSILHNILSSAVATFYVLLVVLSFIFITNNYKKLGDTTGFVLLCFIGLVAAFLMVEVMNRYMMIFYPILIYVASLSISNLADKFLARHGNTKLSKSKA